MNEVRQQLMVAAAGRGIFAGALTLIGAALLGNAVMHIASAGGGLMFAAGCLLLSLAWLYYTHDIKEKVLVTGFLFVLGAGMFVHSHWLESQYASVSAKVLGTVIMIGAAIIFEFFE